MNYGKDINLYDVRFVSAEEGWAVGAKNTVLHTKDGGKTWEAQLGGDPESTDRELNEVFFLDAKTGWTRGSAEKVLRTANGGATWEEMGKLTAHGKHIKFTSPQTGFAVYSRYVLRTEDAGKTWKPAYECRLDLQVQGLAREAECEFHDLNFPTAQEGYAVGQVHGIAGLRAGAVARTQDGGSTWTVAAPEALNDYAMQVYAWTAKAGLITMYGGKSVLTSDGGDTWTGIMTPFGGEHALYAEAGDLGVIVQYKQISYSTNGAHSFSAGAFPVPAEPRAIHFPDARHGYLVGDHGMVYRYRIVPLEYSAPGMIGAVAAPGS